MGLITGTDYRNGHLSMALSTLNAFYMHKNTLVILFVLCLGV